MSEESFGSLVNRLTETHRVTVERDGGTEYPETDGLLQRMRQAIFVGMEGGGSGSAFGAKLPMDAGAYDLDEEITYQAAEALVAVTNQPVGLGEAEDYVREWSELVDPEKLVVVTVKATNDNGVVYRERHQYTAHALAAHWARRIDEFFDPPKRQRPIQAACPDCGARFVSRWKDGERIQTDAFNIHFDHNGNVEAARCSACPAEWFPGSFVTTLRHLIGAKPIPELDTPTR